MPARRGPNLDCSIEADCPVKASTDAAARWRIDSPQDQPQNIKDPRVDDGLKVSFVAGKRHRLVHRVSVEPASSMDAL